MSIRVLIADDHPLVREGLRFRIEHSDQDIRVVAEAPDGVEAVKLAERQAVDVFVLDITMPRMNGLDAARALTAKFPKAKVIMLSIHDSRAFVGEALQSGAAGYLTKQTATRNIVDAIREVHAGRCYLSPDVTSFVVDRGTAGTARRTGPAGSRLTARERDVLQLIAEGRTSKEIATALSLAVNTVHSHRTRLMAKLDIHKETDLVRFAIKTGIARL